MTLTGRCCIVLMLGTFVPYTLGAEKENWINPNDMLNFDLSTGKMRTNPTEKKSTSSGKDTKNHDMTKPTAAELDPAHHSLPAPNADLEKETMDLKAEWDGQRQHLERQLTECLNTQMEKPVSDMPYFRRFVRILLKHLDPSLHTDLHNPDSEVHYHAHLLLSQGDYMALQRFVENSETGVQDAHSALVSMLQDVWYVGPEAAGKPGWMSHLRENWPELVFGTTQVLSTIAAVVIAVNLLIRLRVSLTHLAIKAIVLLFMVSLPWKWWHLVQKEVAKRHASMLQEMPVECRPNEQTLFQALTSALSLGPDKCAQYHEQLHIDPWIEVPPTKALAVTITTFLLEPLEYIGEGIGKLVRGSLQGLPVYLWPYVLVFLTLLVLLILIMGCGYKIRLPFLFSLEPHRMNVDPARLTQSLEDIQNQIQQLRETTQGRQEPSVARGLQEPQNISPSLDFMDSHSPSSASDIAGAGTGRVQAILPQAAQRSTTTPAKQTKSQVFSAKPASIAMESATAVGDHVLKEATGHSIQTDASRIDDKGIETVGACGLTETGHPPGTAILQPKVTSLQSAAAVVKTQGVETQDAGVNTRGTRNEGMEIIALNRDHTKDATSEDTDTRDANIKDGVGIVCPDVNMSQDGGAGTQPQKLETQGIDLAVESTRVGAQDAVPGADSPQRPDSSDSDLEILDEESSVF